MKYFGFLVFATILAVISSVTCYGPPEGFGLPEDLPGGFPGEVPELPGGYPVGVPKPPKLPFP